MYKKVQEYVEKNKMFVNCSHVVLGLSGGADSVCLFLILNRLKDVYGFGISAVHLHHGIRGEEANRDLDFCRKLCEENGVEFVSVRKNVPEYAKENGLTVEEAGRKLRYEAFAKEAKRHDRSVIAVAHHGNDRAETILFNMVRGTGIKGLIGIKPVRDNIVRPLLCCSKEEILEFLAKENMGFCEDSTNSETDYSRNKIRHIVLPKLTEINQGAVGNICSMADRLADSWDYLEKQTVEEYTKHTVSSESGILIKNTLPEHPFMRKSVIIMAIKGLTNSLKDIEEEHINAIMGLFNKDTGAKVNIKYGITAYRDRNGIFLSNICNVAGEDIAIDMEENDEITINTEKFSFNLRKILWNDKEKITNLVYTKLLDYDKIQNDLHIRNRRDGDFLAIDDKMHKKKLNRYFIDAGVPERDREHTLVLADGSHIMWVVGGRISEAYKVTDNTRMVLRVEARPVEALNGKY